ncbi:hypothetical protein Tco_0053700 [Tanacetum coccineum]
MDNDFFMDNELCMIFGIIDRKFKFYEGCPSCGDGGGGEYGEGSGVYWWQRVEKVVVGRRRYSGVMVVEEIE